MNNINLIHTFEECLKTQDGKILYLLALISVTMIIDFVTGTLAAKYNDNITFRSKEGINGILRKICSIILMLVFVPFALIIPGGAGLSLVYILYVGYEFMELKSVVENIGKMGGETKLFLDFLNKLDETNRRGK